MNLKHEETVHPFAQNEPEPPPPPPSVVGDVTMSWRPTEPLSKMDATKFWPADCGSVRQVVIVWLPDWDEFVAFGIFPNPTPDSLSHCCKVPFMVWGRLSTEYQLFLGMMEDSGAEWEKYDKAPLGGMQMRIDYILAQHTSQTLLAA